MFLLVPTPLWADHVPTQEPYGYNESINTETGALTLSILSSDGFEDSPPEKYTIFFAMATGVDTASFCISTSFGHQTNTWQDQVFSLVDLRTYFELPVGTFYYRIRSDNDTDNSFSTISAERNIALPDQVPFNESQTNWSAPTNTCNDTATTTTTTTTVPDTTTTSSSTTSTTTTSSSTTTTTTTTTIPPTEEELNFAVTGIYETNSERSNREENEAEVARVQAAQDWERDKNLQETGFYELDSERRDREARTVVVGDTEVEYSQTEIDDGTLDRDMQRYDNLQLYGCEMTNQQIERGDCDIVEEEILNEEEEYNAEEEFFNDDDVVLELEFEDENEEFIELTEEEIYKLEKQMQIEAKELELLEEEVFIELNLEELTEEELEEFVEVILELEEYIEELEEFDIEEITIGEIPEEIIIIIEDEEIIEEEEILDEEIIEDDTTEDRSMETDDVLEDREDELGRDTTGTIELSEEELVKEIEELEEVIVIEEIFTEEIPVEELEQLSEEEILEYEEAKEEAIEQYVEELETEEVIEVLEEVNDIGLNNIAEASQDVIEVVAQVVEEVITIAQEEELTEEQVEVVAEVLGFKETEDVEIIAEAVKSDENVAQAVDEFVERAVENKDVENYTLADATTEIAFETFVADPISVIIDVDLENITLNNITSDMTQDQKEKAQEVIVPTLLVRIASFAFRRFN